MLAERIQYRTGALSAFAGALLLVAGTWLHPSHADPGDSAAAFAEYAATSRGEWVTSHLAQLAGVAGMLFAAILLAQALPGARDTAWARLTTVCGAASLALAATVQAVDGVALKVMCDLWAGAAAGDKAALFAATSGVRQVEIGLDALLGLVGGATVLAFGFALLATAGAGRVLGVAAITLGTTSAVGGVLTALDSYGPVAMLVTMVSGAFTVLWMVALGVWSWRLSATRNDSGGA